MDSIAINFNPVRVSILLSATNLVLIGFMGSGKSSIGRLLAKEKEGYFLDTDAMIESAEGRSVSEIFEKEGEEYFRSLEKKTVKWLKSNVKQSVISTGGGMLVYCEELKEVGKIIYLKVPFETILARLSREELEKRPLFKNEAEAKALYDERNAVYESRADIIIDADDKLENVFKSVLDAKI